MCPFCQTVTHKNVTHKELGVYDVCTHRVNISKPPALLMESLFELCGRATKKKKLYGALPPSLSLSLSPSLSLSLPLSWLVSAFISQFESLMPFLLFISLSAPRLCPSHHVSVRFFSSRFSAFCPGARVFRCCQRPISK